MIPTPTLRRDYPELGRVAASMSAALPIHLRRVALASVRG